MLIFLGWAATISVIVSYAYMTKTGNVNQFNVVNVLAAFPLVALSVTAGLWPNAIVSITFGVVGLWGIIKDTRTNEKRSS